MNALDTTSRPVPTAPTAVPQGDENIGELIGRLTSQSAHLAKEQISLVQAEMRESVNDLKAAVGAIAGAAVLGMAGLGVTLMGVAYMIGDAIGDRDLATLLVGIATLIVAAVLYFSAKGKLAATNLKPSRSIEMADRTTDAVTGNIHSTGATR